MKRFYYRFKNALALIGIGVTLCHKYTSEDVTAGIVVLIFIMLILLSKVQLEDECA
jgi:hypothetical protein